MIKIILEGKDLFEMLKRAQAMMDKGYTSTHSEFEGGRWIITMAKTLQ